MALNAEGVVVVNAAGPWASRPGPGRRRVGKGVMALNGEGVVVVNAAGPWASRPAHERVWA